VANPRKNLPTIGSGFFAAKLILYNPSQKHRMGAFDEISSTLEPRFPDETPKVRRIRFRENPFGGVVTAGPRFADHLKRECLTSPARKLKTEHDILSDEGK
jgi:hypothetical protein